MPSSSSKKRSPTNKLRWQILIKSFKNIIFSPLCIMVGCLVVSCVLLVVMGSFLPLGIAVVVGSYLFKRIVFEVLLVVHVVQHSLGLWAWYTRIDDKLYLGAIPLESLHHRSHLALDLNVKAVLSINQPYELHAHTIVGVAVAKEQWEEDEVVHLVLPSPDFSAPPQDILDRGADFIKEHILLKHAVYVHCKSGIGRSASVVVAYLIKHRGMPAHAAAAYVRTRRPAIFSPQSPQMKNILLYEARLKSSGSSGAALGNV